MKSFLKKAALFLPVVLFLGLLFYGLKTHNRPIEGREAPDFSLQLFSGEAFHLNDQRGRVAVVNFWASWCLPCREEAPTLEAFWRSYRSKGVVMVGVNIWDTESSARAFIEEFGITYPNGPDRKGTIAIDYRVTGVPETFFIDREGKIIHRHIGPVNRRLMETIAEALG